MGRKRGKDPIETVKGLLRRLAGREPGSAEILGIAPALRDLRARLGRARAIAPACDLSPGVRDLMKRLGWNPPFPGGGGPGAA